MILPIGHDQTSLFALAAGACAVLALALAGLRAARRGARPAPELRAAARREATALLRILPELVAQGQRDAAVAALRGVVAGDARGLSVGQAVRAAELAADLDPPTALAAARSALARGELADARRDHLERLARELEARVEGAPRASAPLTPGEPDAAAPAPAETADAPRAKITAAVPVALDPAGVRLRVENGAPSLVTWERIQAVGVGLVSGLAPKPIVVIDLALNWAESHAGEIEVLRLRSDSFRARALVGGDGSALDALRTLLAELLARSGAVPLPDAASARGLPFREFADSSTYEREVLLQEG